MRSRLGDLFERQLESGLGGFSGSEVTAEIPLREDLLNELLHRSGGVPNDLRVGIEPGNRLVVRYGVLHATATIGRVTMTPLPQVHLRLASAAVAWALRMMRHPLIELSGRDVTIDLGRVPFVVRYRRLWPHVREVRIGTAAGRLHIRVELAVRGDEPPRHATAGGGEG